MTRVISSPYAFSEDALAGFVSVYQREIQRVPGGVSRRAAPPEKVALVIGGGSGHYPAFAGYVGPGLADGAALGDVFASPATSRVLSVARACAGRRGVLLGYGNYAGDCLNFRAAAAQLIQDGIPAKYIEVTDDIASAPADRADQRRGVAGDLFVFKVAGAAAERGDSLEEVASLAALANERTRTLGVAFTGCTLPGHESPLFTVPSGRMGLGMGVHGEQGLAELEQLSAPSLAEELVSRVLSEAPRNAGPEVAVLLNGLGATKYEELFGLWRWVSARLASAGLRIMAPLVGEYVTSLDMAGVSLTISWLDDELTECWLAGVDTPALSRASLTRTGAVWEANGESGAPEAGSLDACEADEVGEAADALAVRVARFLALLAERLETEERRLGELDAVAGDGDHGQAMARGSAAAAAAARLAARAGKSSSEALKAGGDAWAERAGGTSGMLWGAAISAVAASRATGLPSPAASARAAVARLQQLGGAEVGDKTMMDAVVPFASSLESEISSGRSLPTALETATAAARAGAEATAGIQAKLGRARSHADRSVGHQDPGAASFVIACEVLTAFVGGTTI